MGLQLSPILVLMLSSAVNALATPREASFKSVVDSMTMADDGILELAPEGTLSSLDGAGTIIGTKQLSPAEFADATGGCVLATVINPSPAQPAGCLFTDGGVSQPATAHTSPAKRHGNMLDSRELKCTAFVCKQHYDCYTLTLASCSACLRLIGVSFGVCKP